MDGMIDMLLWDEESRSWDEMVDTVSLLGKRKIGLDAIELGVASFRPSFEESFDASTVGFVRETLVALRHTLENDSPDILEEGFFDDLYALQEHDNSLGAASLVMAISFYADSVGRELSTDTVLEIMSASYEAVLNSERIPRVTVAAERENENLVGLIAAQRNLIESAVREEFLCQIMIDDLASGAHEIAEPTSMTIKAARRPGSTEP